jgi:hypothetical protein
MVPGLAKGVQDILPFADTVIEDIIADGEMKLLEESATKLLDLIEKTACFICKYVKQSRARK